MMSRIAIWGPIIPIGLGCATLSSALGSILVAPRTLQALAADEVAPSGALNRYLAAGTGPQNEPRHAALVTSLFAVACAGIGSIDFVARIVSMFFMVTYGSLCAISFLEHFSARPSYRPSFRSKWYLSLLGAVLSFLLMFQMDPGYALLAILLMIGTYTGLRASKGGEDDLAEIFRGVMTQTTRHFQTRAAALVVRAPGSRVAPERHRRRGTHVRALGPAAGPHLALPAPGIRDLSPPDAREAQRREVRRERATGSAPRRSHRGAGERRGRRHTGFAVVAYRARAGVPDSERHRQAFQYHSLRVRRHRRRFTAGRDSRRFRSRLAIAHQPPRIASWRALLRQPSRFASLVHLERRRQRRDDDSARLYSPRTPRLEQRRRSGSSPPIRETRSPNGRTA